MILKKWECLPEALRTDAVRPYYDMLKKKQFSLFFKRVFDILVSGILLLILLPVFLIFDRYQIKKNGRMRNDPAKIK